MNTNIPVSATKPAHTTRSYVVTENAVETTVEASSQQSAMNAYFGVERAVKRMQPRGEWSDKRGGIRSATIRAKSQA